MQVHLWSVSCESTLFAIMAGCIAMLEFHDNDGRNMMARKAYMLTRYHGLYALAAKQLEGGPQALHETMHVL